MLPYFRYDRRGLYQTSYKAAHELLHQYVLKSYTYIQKEGFWFWEYGWKHKIDHINNPDNLLQDGHVSHGFVPS